MDARSSSKSLTHEYPRPFGSAKLTLENWTPEDGVPLVKDSSSVSACPLLVIAIPRLSCFKVAEVMLLPDLQSDKPKCSGSKTKHTHKHEACKDAVQGCHARMPCRKHSCDCLGVSRRETAGNFCCLACQNQAITRNK